MSRVVCRLATLAALVSLGGCRSSEPPPPDISLTIATGGTGGSFYPLGAALARIYSARTPGVRATSRSTVASVFNVQAVQQGKADVAFTQGDVAYFAYRRGTENDPQPHTRLRGIAVLWVNTVQLVVRRDSDILAVRDLRGKRVGLVTGERHRAGGPHRDRSARVQGRRRES